MQKGFYIVLTVCILFTLFSKALTTPVCLDATQPLNVRFENLLSKMTLKHIQGISLFSLKGFKRVQLQPCESKQVNFTVTQQILSVVDEEAKWSFIRVSIKYI